MDDAVGPIDCWQQGIISKRIETSLRMLMPRTIDKILT